MGSESPNGGGGVRLLRWALVLVAAGAVAGFVAAMLKPRPATDYRSSYLPPVPDGSSGLK